MPKDTSFHDYIMQDILNNISGITSRSMFGGYGIYKNGIIFGLIANDVLYFKVDETNKRDYKEKGSKPFTYAQGNHKPTVMSYWEIPEDILENKDLLNEWIEKAVLVSKNKKIKKKL